jgi:hypothetical protein
VKVACVKSSTRERKASNKLLEKKSNFAQPRNTRNFFASSAVSSCVYTGSLSFLPASLVYYRAGGVLLALIWQQNSTDFASKQGRIPSGGNVLGSKKVWYSKLVVLAIPRGPGGPKGPKRTK